MPEASADFRTWTVRLRRGIHFADDPAFQGQPRELIAADVVFSFKRHYDPAIKSPACELASKDDGLRRPRGGVARTALARKRTPFDYRHARFPGCARIDRRTLQFRARPRPRPRFASRTWPAPVGCGAVAREVVQGMYGEQT